MKENKWHLRMVRGKWQGVRRVGNLLAVLILPIQNPAVYLCTQHVPIHLELLERHR